MIGVTRQERRKKVWQVCSAAKEGGGKALAVCPIKTAQKNPVKMVPNNSLGIWCPKLAVSADALTGCSFWFVSLWSFPPTLTWWGWREGEARWGSPLDSYVASYVGLGWGGRGLAPAGPWFILFLLQHQSLLLLFLQLLVPAGSSSKHYGWGRTREERKPSYRGIKVLLQLEICPIISNSSRNKANNWQ